jgi:hypothetical protein
MDKVGTELRHHYGHHFIMMNEGTFRGPLESGKGHAGYKPDIISSHLYKDDVP